MMVDAFAILFWAFRRFRHILPLGSRVLSHRETHLLSIYFTARTALSLYSLSIDKYFYLKQKGA